MKDEWTLTIRGEVRRFTEPVVMGIINCTPDSFYAPSRGQLRDDVMAMARAHVEAGAAMLDLGAFSTRPGGEMISEDEELSRLQGPLAWVSEAFPEVLLSVDTFRASVADYCLEHGAHIINDISGGQFDSSILDVVARADVPYIVMHLQGDPATMHASYTYEQIEQDVMDYFTSLLERLEAKGITQGIIDPGFGFSKPLEDNFRLLRHLDMLQALHRPVLVGVSRKRMIWQTLDTSPAQALNGTTVLNSIALTKGASILRVHDVKEAVEAVRLVASVCDVIVP